MSEDRILESIGKLSGLVEASRDDIKNINIKVDKQCEAVDKITTAMAVMQNTCVTTTTSCSNHFKDFNEKLGRDYTRINDLEKKQLVENGVESYKGKKRAWWQWLIGIIGGVIGILISINQLKQLVNISNMNPIPTVYSQQIIKDTVIKYDTVIINR